MAQSRRSAKRPAPDDFRTRVAGCTLRSAAFNRCAHTVPSGHRLARRGFFLLIFLSYSFGPPFLAAGNDRPAVRNGITCSSASSGSEKEMSSPTIS